MTEYEVPKSKLGTKEHWESTYTREIVNWQENGDVGEVWFGEHSLKTLVKWISTKLPELQKDNKIIDIGTGNGYTLISLWEKGFTNLHGTDYCQEAVDLAISIAEKEECKINFFVDDILNSKIDDVFDVVLDKGTFDAIALSEESKKNRELYKETIYKILNDSQNSYFVITSCNFTKPELLEQFKDMEYHSEIEYPKFKFGGVEGSTITTICFKKKIK